MVAPTLSSSHGRLSFVTWAAHGTMMLASVLAASLTGTRHGVRADEDSPPAAFQPQDISIGEPIALPFAKSADPSPQIPRERTPAATGAGPAGWLGLAVAESTVPGRWAIVEVTPSGPAAAVGIAVGDELRGVNGRSIASADDVSEVLTAITAGQKVLLSVARADQVGDIAVVATARPTAIPTDPTPRTWGASAEPAAAEPPAPTVSATVSVLAHAASAPPTTPAAPPITSAPPPSSGSASPPMASPPAVASLPPTASSGQLPVSRGRTALGVRTVPIDRGIQERFRLPQASGAYVIGVVGDLPASKAGVPPGSVIVSLADQPVRSPQELTQLVAAGPTNRAVTLHYVLPGGTEKRAEVVLQSLDVPLEHALVGESAPQPMAAPPSLVPGPAPRMARRLDTTPAEDAAEIRREMGRLRTMLDALERRLERIGR